MNNQSKLIREQSLFSQWRSTVWLTISYQCSVCMNNARQSGYNTSTRDSISCVEFTDCCGKSMKYEQVLRLTVVCFQPAHWLLSPWWQSATFVD